MKEYKTKTAIFYVDEYGIVHKKTRADINIKPEDIEEDEQMLIHLTKGRKAMVMVDSQTFYTFTPEAIKKLAHYMQKSRYATAIISQKLGVRNFVDTVTLITKNNPPFRMFSTKKEAKKWLLSLKTEPLKVRKESRHNAPVSSPESNKLKARAYHVRFDKNGILVKKIHNGAHINLDIAKKSETDVFKLVRNQKVLALVDSSSLYTITKEAVKYLQKEIRSNKTRIATALLYSRPGHVHPSVSARKNKDAPPVKIFNDKAEAVKWLLSFKKNNPGV